MPRPAKADDRGAGCRHRISPAVILDVDDTYFHGVTRFATSAFMRAKLGGTLESRGVAPHIYESESEATAAVRTTVPRQE